MTYHTPPCIPVERVPADAHHHRVNAAVALPRLVFIIFGIRRAEVKTSPAIVDPALEIFLSAYAETFKWDVGGRDTKLQKQKISVSGFGSEPIGWSL